MVYNALFVFLGSGLGGVCRWALSSCLNGVHPLGTFSANILGCFLIGLLGKLIPGDAQMKLFLITGFCGGFTTFSTFINENFMMLKSSQLILAITYLLLSIVSGLLACWFGTNILK